MDCCMTIRSLGVNTRRHQGNVLGTLDCCMTYYNYMSNFFPLLTTLYTGALMHEP